MHTETIEHAGLSFMVATRQDLGMRAPWKEHDGHGPVREASSYYGKPHKRAGETIIHVDRGRYWLYDVAEATRIAKRDGWGIDPERKAAWEARIGRPLTAGEIAKAAVESDMDRLRGWLKDRWTWVYVKVTLLDTDGDTTWEYDCFGGIESDAGEYLDEVAADLAASIADRVGGDTHILMGAKSIRIRPEPIAA